MHNSQATQQVKNVHNQFVDLAKAKNYNDMLSSTESLMTKKGQEFTKAFLNFKNDDDKTLIHHIVANPDGGGRPGVWALIELHIKGADLTLADSLGNTGLHTCVNTYRPIMQAQVSSQGLTVFASDITRGLIPVKTGNRPADEQIMFACMADVGALLWCGADPKAKNQKGEDVFGMMASVATLIKPDSAKPNICEASCRKAFLAFFAEKKSWFVYDEIFKKVFYPWASNVPGWVEALPVDDSVKNASLVADKPQINHPNQHLVLVTTNAPTKAADSGGCRLF